MNVKPGLEEEYAKYVKINSEDEYSKGVVDAGERVSAILDEDKTPQEALEGLKGFGLTGFMATMAVKAVAHFNPRGDEIRRAWNKDRGAEDEQEGLINPATVTIHKDGKIVPDVEEV